MPVGVGMRTTGAQVQRVSVARLGPISRPIWQPEAIGSRKPHNVRRVAHMTGSVVVLTPI